MLRGTLPGSGESEGLSFARRYRGRRGLKSRCARFMGVTHPAFGDLADRFEESSGGALLFIDGGLSFAGSFAGSPSRAPLCSQEHHTSDPRIRRCIKHRFSWLSWLCPMSPCGCVICLFRCLAFCSNNQDLLLNWADTCVPVLWCHRDLVGI